MDGRGFCTLRKAHGLTQKDVLQDYQGEMSLETLFDIECGRILLPLGLYVHLCKLSGMSLQEIRDSIYPGERSGHAE